MACEITSLQLQAEALALLKKEYPTRPFTRGPNLDVVLMGEVEFGLQNLRSRICLAEPPLTAAAREDAIREHFTAMMALVKEREPKLPHSWKEAESIVSLQFMSVDYLRPFKGARVLVTRPFVEDVLLAVVLVQKNGYGYVREEDRVRWKVDEKVLFETALKNLDLRNTDAKLQGGGGPDRFLALEEKDGYDAVRLLVPWVRQEAAKYLGEPFFAVIPNRDFLVMWSTKNGSGFQSFARSRAEDDFKTQPFPLTAAVLKVWADGRMELVP
ncbi:MAG: hypothetical protein Q8Q73_10860 [Stagnimonas sp.]|nr:hypothetical protein [Stagnimonas sp.]